MTTTRSIYAAPRGLGSTLLVLCVFVAQISFANEAARPAGLVARAKARWSDKVAVKKAVGTAAMGALTLVAGVAIDHVMHTHGAGTMVTTAVSSAIPTMVAFAANRGLAKTRFRAYSDTSTEGKDGRHFLLSAREAAKEGGYAALAGVATEVGLDLMASASKSSMGGALAGATTRFVLPVAKKYAKVVGSRIAHRASSAAKHAGSFSFGQGVSTGVDTARARSESALQRD